jgi:hypothetical protein
VNETELRISYRRTETKPRTELNVFLKNDVLELKLFESTTDAKSKECSSTKAADTIDFFIAFRIIKRTANILGSLSTYSGIDNDFKKGYIVVELKNRMDYQQVVQQLKLVAELCIDESSHLDDTNMSNYCQSLSSDSNKSFERRKSLTAQFTFLEGKTEGDILLVYPFAGDISEIDKAADGLKEAGGSIKNSKQDQAILISEKENSNNARSTISHPEVPTVIDQAVIPAITRGHFLTIRFADFSRLEPKEYLNDTLVDFWFQW